MTSRSEIFPWSFKRVQSIKTFIKFSRHWRNSAVIVLQCSCQGSICKQKHLIKEPNRFNNTQSNITTLTWISYGNSNFTPEVLQLLLWTRVHWPDGNILKSQQWKMHIGVKNPFSALRRFHLLGCLLTTVRLQVHLHRISLCVWSWNWLSKQQWSSKWSNI